MRNADRDDFILNTGDSKFLNFNSIPSSLSTAIISDYMSMTRPAKQQQRKVKTVTEWEKITEKGRHNTISCQLNIITNKTS